MDVMKTFEMACADYLDFVECAETKEEWAAGKVFGLCTYDAALDKLFVDKIIEVCKVILDHKTYEYIEESDDNYANYILVCQLLRNKHWISWGTSIRGAWFDKCADSEPIIDDWGSELTYYEPFSEDNLRVFIEFMEKRAYVHIHCTD